MKQAAFEERYGINWRAFEEWLDRQELLKRKDPKHLPAAELSDDRVPARYREICQHLALARDRQYGPDLCDRLNRLVLRGHHLFYRTQTARAGSVADFLFVAFPAAVREERGLVLTACAMFFGPLLLLTALLQWYPEAVYYALGAHEVSAVQEMYNPANPRPGLRSGATSFGMFGLYVWNNVRIGFQTFAGGLAFGLGTVFYLVANGVHIGAVAGHLTELGYGRTFWSFVSGHSAFELTAIVLCGAAGLRLGLSVIAPGRATRLAALKAGARRAIRIVWGAAAMLLIAACIEAFWSPHAGIPVTAKYVVGCLGWAVVFAYFLLLGRKRGY